VQQLVLAGRLQAMVIREGGTNVFSPAFCAIRRYIQEGSAREWVTARVVLDGGHQSGGGEDLLGTLPWIYQQQSVRIRCLHDC
jgi:hypothetical protein